MSTPEHFFSLLNLTGFFTTFAVIGRGGEQITRLQAESGAKIQMAPDAGGLPDRVCTLTGSQEAIR
jgi:hypothetical protein